MPATNPLARYVALAMNREEPFREPRLRREQPRANGESREPARAARPRLIRPVRASGEWLR
jgi:hypothetical protein